MINTIGRLWDNNDDREYELKWNKAIEEQRLWDEKALDPWGEPKEEYLHYYIADNDDDDYRDYPMDKAEELKAWIECANEKSLYFYETQVFRSIMYHNEIADAWALSFDSDHLPTPKTIESHKKLKRKYIDLLEKSAFGMELKAEISRLNHQRNWKIIGDTMIDRAELYDDISRVSLQNAPKIDFRVLVNRNDFIVWLSKINMQVDKDCLLNEWLKNIQLLDNMVHAKPEATHIKKVRDKQIRKNELHHLIWKAYLDLIVRKPNSTAHDLYKEIKNNYSVYDSDNIIIKIDKEYIEWVSQYKNVNSLLRTTFGKTLSTLKRNPPF